MPGMMDTILNLGLNDENVLTLARKTDDARFAYDCYRRLLQMFGEVVYDIPMASFDTYFEQYKAPKFKIVSIIPGIEIFAPLRTETNSKSEPAENDL